MNDDTVPPIIASILVTFVIAVICFLLGCNAGEQTIRQQALKLNLAHYDARTGDFAWGGVTPYTFPPLSGSAYSGE